MEKDTVPKGHSPNLRGDAITRAIAHWARAQVDDPDYVPIHSQVLPKFTDGVTVLRLIESKNMRGLFRLCRELCEEVGVPDPSTFNAEDHFRLHFKAKSGNFVMVDIALTARGDVAADYFFSDGSKPQ